MTLLARMCLQVFTTCGSDRKKKYLLDTFPRLCEDHIGHSRDCSFEDLIMHKVCSSYFFCSQSCADSAVATPRTTLPRPWSCTRNDCLVSKAAVVLVRPIHVQIICDQASLLLYRAQSWNAAVNVCASGTP